MIDALWEKVKKAAVHGPGEVDPATRAAAFGGQGVPAPLAAIVEKIRRHAYRVTDDDVRALQAAGFTEDQIFEVTIAAAVGAGSDRLAAFRRSWK